MADPITANTANLLLACLSCPYVLDGLAHQPESERADFLVDFLPFLIWIVRPGMSHMFIDIREAVHLVERATVGRRVQVKVISQLVRFVQAPSHELLADASASVVGMGQDDEEVWSNYQYRNRYGYSI